MSLSTALFKIDTNDLFNKKVFSLTMIDRIVYSLFYSGEIKTIYLDEQYIKPSYLKRGIKCLPLQEYKNEKALVVDVPVIINHEFVKSLLIEKNDSVFFSELENSQDKYDVFIKINYKEDLSEAKVKLRIALRKKKDTLLAFLFNRSISTRISIFIVTFCPFISPNMISFFSLCLGLGAFALLASSASYGLGILSGVMYYLASLFDGVDGEVARVKYQFSDFGLWLDNITDELLNFLLVIGVTLYSYNLTQEKIFLTLTIISLVLLTLTKIVQYILIILKLQPSDVSQFKLPYINKNTFLARFFNITVIVCSNIPRSDTIRFLLLIFAVFKLIPFYSYGISLFSVVFFIGVLISAVQVLKSR